MKVVIVGGVAGGASAAARLRRLDENAEIVLFERGEYVSFANCGLPYYVGGEIKTKEALTLQTPESFRSRFNVDVRISSEVVAIDRKNKTVRVQTTEKAYDEPYDKLILSTGAEPIMPLSVEKDRRVFTLRNIPDTYKIKDYVENNKVKTAAVVGGGYIGVEIAENLTALGIEVSLIELADHVIAPLDFDIAVDVHNHMRSKGVSLYLANGLKKLTGEESCLTLQLNQGIVRADMAVIAIGVKPESKLARDAGLPLGKKDGIVVDSHMKTEDNDIYAVGDAVEVVEFVSGHKAQIPLAGPANRQGRIAADNICGILSEYEGTQGSSVLKIFDMTVAATGINETTARLLGYDCEKSFTFSPSHAGYYPGATNMSVKLLFEKPTGKILGAQIAGFDGVDKRCDVLSTALRAKMTVFDLTKLELCYAPPYSSAKDPVNMAGFVAENSLTGKVKLFHWHDIATVRQDKNAILLDVRTKMEFEGGSIDGFANIPLDSLRARLNELDKNKKIYVHCQSGMRSYLACRILSQNGFVCYNLSGGYRLYSAIYKAKTNKKDGTINVNTETQRVDNINKTSVNNATGATIKVDACGLQCPGPIVKLAAAIKGASLGDTVEISTTDPAFASDIEGYCRRTGHRFLGMVNDKGVSVAKLCKLSQPTEDGCDCHKSTTSGDNKNIIVFSGDLDKAIASFIIANAAAAMGRHVEMFFTFWGLNILRKSKKVKTKKTFMEKIFGLMMPRGSKKLKLSQMNMGGMGSKMIRGIMKKKNVDSLDALIVQAQQNGVVLVACSMSMDVMGIKQEELLDGVKVAGAAAMLANAEESDMSLFI